jgi:hypothetical protein
VIDGAKDPDRIPDRTIQSALMVNFAMLLHDHPDKFATTAKGIGLSAADISIMTPQLLQLQETLVALRQQAKAVMDGQVSDLRQRATLTLPIAQAMNRSTTNAWGGILDSLSAQGREALLRHMQREKRNVKLLSPSPSYPTAGGAQ